MRVLYWDFDDCCRDVVPPFDGIGLGVSFNHDGRQLDVIFVPENDCIFRADDFAQVPVVVSPWC